MEQQNVILLIFVMSIIFNAIGHGLRQRDIESPSIEGGILYHISWAMSHVWLLLLLVKIDNNDLLLYILSFALLRFGLFDILRNAANGKRMLYIGDTAAIDKLANKVFGFNFGMELYLGLKVASLMLGMYLIQNVL